eukprot:Seg6757.3 transcript_id=Seg6757.3/GoldUCD/mRNA.D3Y31 product="hypothetical protein" protein_id=Seg6757.3/GoldUCD/D3Y31
MSANRFLLEDEIQELQTLCYRFGDLLPVFFPERNLTCKMHELVFMVPKFVKELKTLGKLSEEGESLHAAVNQELRQLACVRDQGEKIRLVLERQELRSSVNKLLMKGTARLCGKCKSKGERHFLEQALMGKDIVLSVK